MPVPQAVSQTCSAWRTTLTSARGSELLQQQVRVLPVPRHVQVAPNALMLRGRQHCRWYSCRADIPTSPSAARAQLAGQTAHGQSQRHNVRFTHNATH